MMGRTEDDELLSDFGIRYRFSGGYGARIRRHIDG